MFNSEILVASTDAAAINTLLTKASYNTRASKTGQGALRYLRSNTPALMILDAHLNDIDGTSISYRVKKLSRLRDVPVIILVDNLDSKMRAAAELSNADQIIFKPHTGRALREAVRDWLEPSLVNTIENNQASINQPY